MSVAIRRKNAFRAVQKNNIPELAKAVNNRIEANWREGGHPEGNTLLEYACELGRIEVAEWLVDRGADINAYYLRIPTSVKVIQGGGVMDAVSYLGPLTTAIYFQQVRSLAFLISRGVNLDIPWKRHGTKIVSCRDVLAMCPDFLAEAESIVLTTVGLPGVGQARRRRL